MAAWVYMDDSGTGRYMLDALGTGTARELLDQRPIHHRRAMRCSHLHLFHRRLSNRLNRVRGSA